ncbi:hypothetical protein COE25_08420 [Bacillus sp. AFS031507]|nr:hypothetical protein COE25_08420 [Bacillus sp. AFS031507]
MNGTWRFLKPSIGNHEVCAVFRKLHIPCDTGREDLFRTIESAIRGETLLQPEIMAKLIGAKEKKSKVIAPFEANKLTEKQLFILQATAKGYRNKDIAFDMGIAERTVKAHLTNIYNKLGVNTRTKAVAVALESGMIHL